MYKFGAFEGHTVYKLGIDDEIAGNNTKDFFVLPDGNMYFCGEYIGWVYDGQIREYKRDIVKRLESKVFREKVAKAFENVEAEPVVKKTKVRKSAPTSEEKSVVADSETADRILQSWNSSIDEILKGLMSKELVERV